MHIPSRTVASVPRPPAPNADTNERKEKRTIKTTYYIILYNNNVVFMVLIVNQYYGVLSVFMSLTTRDVVQHKFYYSSMPLRKSRQTFLIIFFHIIPMIEGPLVCFYRNMNLIFIVHKLNQDVSSLVLKEYNLNI